MHGTRRAQGRIHLLDAVALLVAAVAAIAAYTYLLRRAPVPAIVDPLLDSEITVEFAADKPWKQTFPAPGARVVLEDALEADVTGVEASEGLRVVRLHVRGRDLQQPDALTLFRTGVRRGSVLRVCDARDEVRAEVVEVRKAAAER